MKRALKTLLLATLSLGCGSSSFSQGFNETTTGKTEESTNGISPEEAATLDQTQKKLLENFRKGRVSSAKDLKSRYSGHLEMHDENLDGITDHGLRKGQQNLEGQMDAAAFGEVVDHPKERNYQLNPYQVGLDPSKRNKDRVVNNSGNCKDGYIIGTTDSNGIGIPCQNKSANILDAGPAPAPAHAGDDIRNKKAEPHRMYKVSDAAIKNAEVAAEAYANKTVKEASTFDAQALNQEDPNARVSNIGNDKSRIQYVDGEGKTVQKNVAPNLDYLRSEYAWLEEQKKHRLDHTWKTLRASRLAGNPNEVESDVANMIAGNRSDDDLAKYIAEKHLLRGAFRQLYVEGNTVKVRSECLDARGNLDERRCKSYLEVVETTTDPAQRDALRAQAKAKHEESLSRDPEAKRAFDEKFATQVADTKRCLERDVWCQDNADRINQLYEQKAQASNDAAKAAIQRQIDEEQRKMDASKKAFTEVKGQVGGVFKDTREFIATRAAKAYEGPVDEIIKTMTSADFNEQIDKLDANGKAKGTPYQDMLRDVAAIQKMQKDLEQRQAEWEKNDPNYKGTHKFNKNNFNTKTQSVIQMFGINRTRDGRSLSNGRGPAAGPGPFQSTPLPQMPNSRPPSPQNFSGPNY